MRVIENWDKITESGTKIPVGAYVCQIVKANDIADKEYLEIFFDIAEGEYKGYFSNLFRQTGGEKWDNQGILRKSYKTSALSFFKAFTTAVEKSNSGYFWNFDETTLKGKAVVIVFEEEAWENQDGETVYSVKPNDARSIQALREGRIKIKTTAKPAAPAAPTIKVVPEFTTLPLPTFEPDPKPQPQPAPAPSGNIFDDLPF